jgi:hypothetical protein
VFRICQVGGNAVLGFSNDYNYSAGSTSGSCVTNSNFVGGTNPFFISINSFLFFNGTKTAVLALECTSGTVNVSSCNLTVTMIGNSSSIYELLDKYQLSLESTTVNENLVIKINSGNLNYEIFDLSGKQLDFGNIESGINQINTSSLAKGLYLLKVNSTKGETGVLKFNKI